MEYTQWAFTDLEPFLINCLNPCCNGIYSMSAWSPVVSLVTTTVLILVVMEYTQWE